MAGKTVILEKKDQIIFFKAQPLCLGFFNPWKSTFSSSSLGILYLK